MSFTNFVRKHVKIKIGKIYKKSEIHKGRSLYCSAHVKTCNISDHRANHFNSEKSEIKLCCSPGCLAQLLWRKFRNIQNTKSRIKLANSEGRTVLNLEIITRAHKSTPTWTIRNLVKKLSKSEVKTHMHKQSQLEFNKMSSLHKSKPTDCHMQRPTSARIQHAIVYFQKSQPNSLLTTIKTRFLPKFESAERHATTKPNHSIETPQNQEMRRSNGVENSNFSLP